MDDEKKVDQNDVENLEKTTGFKIIEASAKNDHNVNESMIALVDKMLELGLGKIKKEDEEEDEGTKKLSLKNNKKKNNCCGGGGKKKN